MTRFLLYSPMHKWKQGDPLISPMVQIALGDHSRDANERFLTPHLMADSEIDHEIDEMIWALEKLRKEAKRELASLKSRIKG